MWRYKHSSVYTLALVFQGVGRGSRTAVTAVAVTDKEVALGHLAQVVLVQELAALAFLAQAAQPMLADQVVEVTVAALRDVPIRT